MESTANLMFFCGISRKFYKFHGKQQNAMANLEMGLTRSSVLKLAFVLGALLIETVLLSTHNKCFG